MHASPKPRHVALYRLAQIMSAFPAYKLEDARSAPAELLLAAELLGLARLTLSS